MFATGKGKEQETVHRRAFLFRLLHPARADIRQTDWVRS